MDKYYQIGDKINGYSILNIIGEGRYGIAYLAANDNNEKCVVKQLKEEMLEESRSKLFYEEQILRQLDDTRFPKFISNFKDEFREGYLLEYIEGTDFYDLISIHQYQFTKEEIYTVGDQLLKILTLLHEKNIIHRDIRLPNVILKNNNELALIDFGLARFIDHNRYVKQMDYWYFGDFLIYLYYSSFKGIDAEERPWYEELDLTNEEIKFIKKLMGVEEHFHNDQEIKKQLDKIKSII